jgi:hypothetical protein
LTPRGKGRCHPTAVAFPHPSGARGLPPIGHRRKTSQRSNRLFIERFFIEEKDGNRLSATNFEISGMSAVTLGEFVIGTRVELAPGMGERVKAAVRHRQGTMYGCEFTALNATIHEQIRRLCEHLPLFLTSATV